MCYNNLNFNFPHSIVVNSVFWGVLGQQPGIKSYQLKFPDKILKRSKKFSDEVVFNYIEKATNAAGSHVLRDRECDLLFGQMEISACRLI